MCKEAISLPSFEQTTNVYTYETLETTQKIATRLRFIAVTRSEQVAVVVIKLYFEQEGRLLTGATAQAEVSTRHYLEKLRTLVRKTDEVFLMGNSYYFLLVGANLNGGKIVQERLWEALLWSVHNTNESEILRPCSMAIGYSAFPTPQRDAERCLIAASEARLHFNVQQEKATRKTQTQQQKDSELPALARKLGIPYLSLLPRKPSAKVQRLLRPELAHELHCFPLGKERDTLTVAMLDPQDNNALMRLRQETGLHIYPVLTHPHELQSALEQLI